MPDYYEVIWIHVNIMSFAMHLLHANASLWETLMEVSEVMSVFLHLLLL